MNASPVVVRVTHEYGVPPERVFDAWLDVRIAQKFLFATTSGQMLRTEMDPRVGGGFLFIERRAAGDAEHYGKFLKIERPRIIIFDFHVEKNATQLSRVTLDFSPSAKGCLLTLTHEIDPAFAEYAARTEQGWTMILGNLENTII